MQRSKVVVLGVYMGLATMMQVSLSLADSASSDMAIATPTSTVMAAPAESTPVTIAPIAESAPVAVAPVEAASVPGATAVLVPPAVVSTTATEAVVSPSTTVVAAPTTDVEPTAAVVPAAVVPTSTSVTAVVAAAPDSVVASVDGSVLTQAELDKRVASAMKSEGVQSWPTDLVDTAKKQYEEQVKELFVTRTVLANEAKRQNITTTDAEVDEIVSTLKGRLKAGRTLDDLIADHGITMEQLRKELADDRIIEKLIDKEVLEKNAPTEEEMKAFYTANAGQFAKDEKVRASHILIKVEPTDTPDVKKAKLAKIQGLRSQLTNGADFAELAKKNSDCPSAPQGGDLGEFGRGMMVKPFEEAAFSQATGVVGEVVETQFGYHLIKVTEKTAGKATAYEDVKDEVRKQMQSTNGEVAVRDFIDGLRAKATITGLTPVAVPKEESPVAAPEATTKEAAPSSATPAAAPIM